jgi:hypothetical protein
MCIFLGLATCIVAAMLFFSLGKRAGQCAEVNFDALHAASECISAGRRGAMDSLSAAGDQELSPHDKAKWLEMKGVWMRCYSQCREKALLRRKQMCGWARTFALCAAICLVNLVLEIEFGEPIRISSIRPRTGHQAAAASHLQSPQPQPSPGTSTSISNRFPRK